MAPQNAASRQTRIVLVDGSGVSRKLLTRMLHEQLDDVEVVGCASGSEAVQALAKGDVDLVSTALLLPDMDGLDLATRVRRFKDHKYTPIVIVSSHDDPELLRKGLKAGVTDYFDKSHGYKAFGEFVRVFIQRQSRLDGRILYVEDSRTAAAMTRPLLERVGLEVIHITSGEAALERFSGAGRPELGFDMIITDLTLKGRLGGEDLLHALRARHHYSQQELPVLVLTGHEDVHTQAKLFHLGANDFVNKPIVEEILLARVRSLLLVKHQYDMLKRQAEAMRLLAITDSLTKTHNKRYLLDHGERFLVAPEHQPVWAMLIDIDHFKSINDTLGHITGDRVLEALGPTICDELQGALVARFGGEEFCVLLPNTTRDQALRRAQAVRERVRAMVVMEVRITISIGVAGYEDHTGSALSRLLALADKALYHAKQNGRDQVSLYGPDGLTSCPHNPILPRIPT